MTSRAFLLSAFLLLVGTARAQTWERVDPSSTGLEATNLQGFAGVAAEGDRLLAAQRDTVDNGLPIHRLYLSTDGGATWAPTELPDGSGQEHVEVIAGRLFTYSTPNLLYYSDDDGVSWTKATGFSSFGNGLYAFRVGMSATDALIGANFVGAYRSTDGGASWTHLPTPTPRYDKGLIPQGRGSDAVATAAGTVLLADYSAGIYRTTDEGVTWTQPWVSPGFNRGILHLTLRPDGAILAHVNSDPRTTLISTDDGETWTDTALITLSAAKLRGERGGMVVWAGGDDRTVQLLKEDAATDVTGNLSCVWQAAITSIYLVATTRCATTQENASHGIYRLELTTMPTTVETIAVPENALEVWPNPALGPSVRARFTAAEGGSVTIRLYDVLGREVHRQAAIAAAGQPTDVVLDVAGFAPGVYLLHVESIHHPITRAIVLGR